LSLVLIWQIYFKENPASLYDFVVAEKGTLIQEINVTGKVKPSEKVELSFERGGKVKRIYVEVGDIVKRGDVLIELENSELFAQLSQAQAELRAQKAKLKELKQGTREEEIEVARTKVLNAQKTLSDAEKNLEAVKQAAESELKKDYASLLTSLSSAVTQAENALFFITEVQYNYFNSADQKSVLLADKKAGAVLALLGRENGGRLTKDTLRALNGGAKGEVEKAREIPTYENIDSALQKTKQALQKLKDALNVIPLSDLTSTELTNLATYKETIDSEIASLSSAEEAIEVQKATNQTNISQAEAEVNSARNTLLLYQKELELKEAGATQEQIEAQEALVEKAQANVESIKAQIAKTIMQSPISGIVTKQEAEQGETVSQGEVLVSIMSLARFKIEAFVPEVDIANLKVGDKAKVALDAYDDVLFEAQVVKIDPAETVVEGVSTYKTVLEFEKEDERIKSGMTADVTIITAKKDNVVAIPQRAVIEKDGKKIVRVIENNKVLEKEVEIGIRGSDGRVEVRKGIAEGEKVIVFMPQK